MIFYNPWCCLTIEKILLIMFIKLVILMMCLKDEAIKFYLTSNYYVCIIHTKKKLYPFLKHKT